MHSTRTLRLPVIAALAVGLVQTARAERPWTIPALQEWTDGTGSYSFGAGTRIVLDAASASELSTTASAFSSDLVALTGLTVPVVIGMAPQAGDIFLALGATDSTIGGEGYLLTVADRITISAQTDAGVFYGTRSVLQMLRQGFRIQAGSARDWPEFPERALMVDVGRKYFTLAFLQRQVKELAYLKLNYFHLHLSDNQGFRIESTSHPEIVSAQHHTKAEMAELIDLGRGYHVTIVPEIDVPAHSQAMLAAHPDLALPGSPDKMDLSKAGNYALVEDLLNEYLPLFPAPFWHTGADEYLYTPTDFARYPQLLTYAQQRYGPSANAEDAYIGFVNWVDGLVKAQGKQLRAWNDIYAPAGSAQAPNPDIVLEMWWPFLWPQTALGKGNTILNAELFTLYYSLGGGAPNATNLYENWAPNKQWVTSVDASGKPSYTDLPASTPGIRGGKFHVWCDSPDAATEDQVQDTIAPALRGVAQSSWGSTKLTPTYSLFMGIADPIGHTPDWGPDFALMGSTTSATVSAGQTATLAVQVAAIGGFNQPVGLSCGFLTAETGMTCSIAPAVVTPAAGLNAPTVTVSVGTTAGAIASVRRPGDGRASGFLWIALVVPVALLAKRSGRPFARAVRCGVAVAAVAVVLGIAGCGSSSSSSAPTPTPTPTPTPNPATQAGTYGVLVQAASGSLSHNISLSVTVSTAAHAVRPAGWQPARGG